MTKPGEGELTSRHRSQRRRVVAMSFLDSSSEYILRAIHAELPLDQVIKIRWADRSRRHAGNPVLTFFDRSIRAIERRLYYDRYYQRQSGKLDSLLSDRHHFPPLGQVIEVDKNRINTPETADLIRSFDPDVLLVCGAPMLKPEIFNVPHLATMNIHYGIAPDYRGEATLFWPLLFKDQQKVGLTVHRIDEGVDTGPILTQVFLPVEPGDDETRLLVKASKAIPGPVVEILRDADFDQADVNRSVIKGRNFRMKDRRVWHDLRVKCQLALARRSQPVSEQRVVRCWQVINS